MPFSVASLRHDDAVSDRLIAALERGLVEPLIRYSFVASGGAGNRGETVECTNGTTLITISTDWLIGRRCSDERPAADRDRGLDRPEADPRSSPVTPPWQRQRRDVGGAAEEDRERPDRTGTGAGAHWRIRAGRRRSRSFVAVGNRHYPRRVTTLLARRPLASALVVWLMLSSVIRGTVAASTDVRERGWTLWVLGGFVAYTAFALWFTTTEKFASAGPAALGPRRFMVRLALSISPVIVASGLAFEGLPVWAIKSALGISGLFLLVGAGLARREKTHGPLVDG
jgi:hypothetical protein